jgi:hypothetical protein
MRPPVCRQRGTALIEIVPVLLFSVSLLAAIVLFGRMTWHWIALEKSIGSTVRILSALPRETLLGTRAEIDIPDRTTKLILSMTGSAGIDTPPTRASLSVLCSGFTCGPGGATTVSVSTRLNFTDTVFDNAYTILFMPESGSMPLNTVYTQLCAPAPTATP